MAKLLNQFWFEEGSICKMGASLKDYINDILIYYFIICILVSMPRIVRNISEISNSGYIQANYVFKKNEIEK